MLLDSYLSRNHFFSSPYDRQRPVDFPSNQSIDNPQYFPLPSPGNIQAMVGHAVPMRFGDFTRFSTVVTCSAMQISLRCISPQLANGVVTAGTHKYVTQKLKSRTDRYMSRARTGELSNEKPSQLSHLDCICKDSCPVLNTSLYLSYICHSIVQW